ncbi:MAG: FimB/Mfa2 family fimbrial subunit, partial [Rikenellaceae bacterium]
MKIMKIQHRRFFGASLLVLAITALMGCTKDPGLNKDPDSPTSVTMNLKLPSPTTMQSYGIDEDRENEVVRLDVFIFDEANNILKNVGHQTIRSFSQSGPTITALVSIDRAVAKQRFCIVANGSDAMLSGITTKAELDALEISSAKMPHQLFVMSAVSELLTVTAADFATKFTFSLIRCVSRLDVKVDKTKVTNFKIKSVKIINARSGGYLYQKKDATGKVTPPTGTTMLDYDKIN